MSVWRAALIWILIAEMIETLEEERNRAMANNLVLELLHAQRQHKEQDSGAKTSDEPPSPDVEVICLCCHHPCC